MCLRYIAVEKKETSEGSERNKNKNSETKRNLSRTKRRKGKRKFLWSYFMWNSVYIFYRWRKRNLETKRTFSELVDVWVYKWSFRIARLVKLSRQRFDRWLRRHCVSLYIEHRRTLLKTVEEVALKRLSPQGSERNRKKTGFHRKISRRVLFSDRYYDFEAWRGFPAQREKHKTDIRAEHFLCRFSLNFNNFAVVWGKLFRGRKAKGEASNNKKN